MLLLCVFVHAWLILGRLGGADAVSFDLSSAEDRVLQFVSKAWGKSRPVQEDGEAVGVTVDVSDVLMKYGSGGEYSGFFCKITAWVRLQWQDYRLDWSNRTDMNSVSAVRLSGAFRWNPSVDVVGLFGKSRTLSKYATEAVVVKTGAVMTVAPVELEVPVRESPPRCTFTITSMLTDMSFIDLRSRSTTFDVDNWSSITGRGTIQRREIKRDCCPKPFAALDYAILF